MAQYLIEIATGDPKIAGKGIYTYETYNDALAAFHSKMGSAMKSDLFETELLCIIDDCGIMSNREQYVKNPTD